VGSGELDGSLAMTASREGSQAMAKECGAPGARSSKCNKVLTVEDCFLISGRGIVVVPGPPVVEYDGPRVDEAELTRFEGER
jgi:hypothetical protein